MANTSQRSLVGMRLDLFKLFGKNYNILEKSTLNTEYGNNAITGKIRTFSNYPTLQYFGFGCGGHPTLDNTSQPTYSYHSPNDCNLFNLAPLAYVEKPSGNTDSDFYHKFQHMNNLRLRKEIGSNNIITGCSYYLKKLDIDDDVYIDDNFTKIIATNGVARLNSYSLNDIENPLKPSPIIRGLNYDDLETKNVEYANVYAHVRISMSLEELERMRDACRRENINPVITEIGLFTGIDYCDAMVVELYLSTTVSIDIAAELNNANSTGFTRYLEIGGSEPLITNYKN